MRTTARTTTPGFLLTLTVTAAAFHGGCARFDAPDSFTSIDPAGRMHAAGQAAAAGDETAVPALVEMLGSDDPAERLIAIAALESITGNRMGFDPSAAPSARRVAQERWRQSVAKPGGAGNDPATVAPTRTEAPLPPPPPPPSPAPRTDR
ncbi:MAG: hypothetical protein Q8L55_02980 [Phycisphaerales bacterium]|nr:hypothetical protein [Phycisphaerales bacterium]